MEQEQNNEILNEIPKQVRDDQKKPLYKKLWFWVIFAAVLIIAFLLLASFYNSKKPKGSQADNKISAIPDTGVTTFITANPMRLSDLKLISKFRSCGGHDYRAKGDISADEPVSSMKHYFQSADVQNIHDLPVAAPFDGEVIDLLGEGNEAGISDNYIIALAPDANPTYEFRFFHMKKGSLKVGQKVHAGEVLAYTVEGGTDIALIKGRNSENQREESIFDHMTDQVYAQYVARGITKDKIIVSREARQADPCICITTPCQPDSGFKNDDENSWVLLK